MGGLGQRRGNFRDNGLYGSFYVNILRKNCGNNWPGTPDQNHTESGINTFSIVRLGGLIGNPAQAWLPLEFRSNKPEIRVTGPGRQEFRHCWPPISTKKSRLLIITLTYNVRILRILHIKRHHAFRVKNAHKTAKNNQIKNNAEQFSHAYRFTFF
jgi:hypothetical protein